MIPQDIYVDATRKLYVLSSHEGIYIFKILGSGDLEEEAKI